jgi:hypothetical protein
MISTACRTLAAVAMLAPAAAYAAEESNMLSRTNQNWLRAGAHFGLNINARFKHSGRFMAPSGPGGTQAGQNHEYDDGFVRRDESDNFGGYTQYWGYDGSGQDTGSSILFHSSTSRGAGPGREIECDPQYGLDVIYSREMGRIRNGRWGFEAGFSWTPIVLRDNHNYRGSVQRIEDAYSYTPGTSPPTAPYEGKFNEPGFVLNDTPTRSVSTIPGGALVTGSRELNADLFGLRLGPFLEMPIGRRCSLYVSGGLALGGVSSEFTWRERVSIEGAGTFSGRGHGSEGDVLVGGYLGAKFNVELRERITAYLGVQYQHLGEYEHSEKGRKAVLDLSQSIFFSVGLGYSF